MTEEEVVKINKQFRRLPAMVRNHIDRLIAAGGVPEEDRYYFISKMMKIIKPVKSTSAPAPKD